MKSPVVWAFAAVLIVALGLRLAAGWWWQSRVPERFGFGDSQSYWTLARAVAHGQPYQYDSPERRVFRTPGYPLVLAPLFVFSPNEPSVAWARVQSAILGTLAVAGVGWIAWRLFDARAALLAAGLAAVEPGSVAAGALVLSEAPFNPLMLLHLGLWMAAWKAHAVRRTVALGFCSGLAAGAATLMRPSWLLFVPFGIGVGILLGLGLTMFRRVPAESRGDKHREQITGVAIQRVAGRHLGIGVVMIAGLVVAMMPWWIRNSLVSGHFVPTSLQVGASLYDGWSPEATGASDMDIVDRAAAEERQSLITEGADPDEIEYRLDRRLRDRAVGWARQHPGRAVHLAVVKLGRLWNVWPNERSFSAWPIRLAVLVTYLPIVALGLCGAVKTFRSGWPYLLCWLPAAYFSVLHMVFVSSIRYRQPAMLLLIVLAAGAVAGWKRGESPHPSSLTPHPSSNS